MVDALVCLDDELMPSTVALAEALGRPIRGEPGTGLTSVLFVARPATLTSDAVWRWARWSVANDVPVGFLVADNDSQAGSQVAKVIAAHRSENTLADGLIDTDAALCGEAQSPGVLRADLVARTLEREWRVLSIGAHSEPAHLNLGAAILCGASGPELLGDSKLVEGCDPRHGRCRRWLGSQTLAMSVADIRAEVLLLFGCNTFGVAAQAYPTDAGLVRAAQEGHAAAVLGTVGPVDTAAGQPAETIELIASGMSLGEVCLALNRAQDPDRENVCFVLAGDPAWRSRPAGVDVREPAAEASGTQAEMVASCVLEALRRSRIAERWHRALAQASAMAPTETTGLAGLAAAGAKVSDVVWDALRDGMRGDPARTENDLTTAMRRWDESFATVATSLGCDDVYYALHEYHRPIGATDDLPCRRCGTVVRCFRFQDPEYAAQVRLAGECRVCGATFERVESGAVLRVSVSGWYQPGENVPVRVSLVEPAGAPSGPGVFALVLDDEPTGNVLAVQRFTGNADQVGDIGLRLPERTRNDLHVIWAIWVKGLDVSFAETRVAVARLT